MDTNTYKMIELYLKAARLEGFNRVYIDARTVTLLNTIDELQFTIPKVTQYVIKKIYTELFHEEFPPSHHANVDIMIFLNEIIEKINGNNRPTIIGINYSLAKKLEKIAYQHDETLSPFITDILEDFVKSYEGE